MNGKRKGFIKSVRGAFQHLIVDAFLPDYENKSTDTHLYGKDNLLPNKLLSFVADSGVGTRAANKVAEYIASDGFVDEVAAKLKVNDTQTADQLLQEQAAYMALLNGAAFHIERTGGLLSTKKVKAIPFQCVRKQINGGGYVYNDTLGQPKYKKECDKIMMPFVSRDLTSDEISSGKYANGEILYIYRKTPYNQHYPVPDYYAQIEDVRTSSEISKMDLELSVNGFMPSSILTIVGDYDNTTVGPDNKTDLEATIDDCKKFTGQVKNAEGLSGRFKALLLFAPTKEQIPNLQTLDLKSTLEGTNTKRDVLGRAVCQLFGVHPVLLGYSDAAVLGNQQALANAALELNKVVNPYQRLFTEAFKQLWPANNWTISEYMPINYVPDALLTDMTQDERRNKLLGLGPVETPATGEGDKVAKALSSLSPLVANKVLESLTPDEIRSLIGLGPQTPPPANG